MFPTPAEPSVGGSFLLRANAMNSAMLLWGANALTTKAVPFTTTRAIGVRSLSGLNASLLSRLGVMVRSPDVANRSVRPSGSDAATEAAPVAPFAPGRFSTMTLVLSRVCSCCANCRAMKSAGPPVASGTMMRTNGSCSCACAGAQVSVSPQVSASTNVSAGISPSKCKRSAALPNIDPIIPFCPRVTGRLDRPRNVLAQANPRTRLVRYLDDAVAHVEAFERVILDVQEFGQLAWIGQVRERGAQMQRMRREQAASDRGAHAAA